MKAVNILKGTPLAWTIIKYCKDLPKIDAPRTAGDFETEHANEEIGRASCRERV